MEGFLILVLKGLVESNRSTALLLAPAIFETEIRARPPQDPKTLQII